MNEFLAFLLFMAIVTALLISVVTGFVWAATAATCATQASKMGFEHSWGPLQDCMILVDGHWIPIGSYRVIK